MLYFKIITMDPKYTPALKKNITNREALFVVFNILLFYLNSIYKKKNLEKCQEIICKKRQHFHVKAYQN